MLIPILLLICFIAVLAVGIKRRKFLRAGAIGLAAAYTISESDLMVSQFQLPGIALLIILALLLFTAVYLVVK